MEKALGYKGDARYVAFYWTPAGDEAMYEDGLMAGTGEWPAWLDYVRHSLVESHLEPYNLGSSDFDADHYLVLDRQERRVYVATVSAARQFLAAQHSQRQGQKAVHLTSEDLLKITEAIRQPTATPVGKVDIAEVEARLQAAQQEHDAMLRWMDQQQGAE